MSLAADSSWGYLMRAYLVVWRPGRQIRRFQLRYARAVTLRCKVRVLWPLGPCPSAVDCVPPKCQHPMLEYCYNQGCGVGVGKNVPTPTPTSV
jgi:hypothetical protein